MTVDQTNGGFDGGPERDSDGIPLFFVTTSSRKYEHLQHLAERESINLVRIPWEYDEIQTDNMGILLEESLNREERFEQIDQTFFIIEQTSVFLNAKDGKGPGQYFKKWWDTKSEEELNLVISRDPGAKIESGLALHVPGHEPLIFTNTQKGRVSLDGGINEENEKYSWLSADDFNRYFIPEGETKVYNQMDIDKFYQHDFRKPNFDKVSERFKEYRAILTEGVTPERLFTIAEEHGTEEDGNNIGQYGESITNTEQSTLHSDYSR